MPLQSLDSVLDRLLGPDERDTALEERRALALEIYDIPDEVMSRSAVADLAVIDKTSKTVKRWQEKAKSEGRRLFPGTIDLPGGGRRYPPDAILRFLAGCRREDDAERDPAAGSPGRGEQITETGADDGPDEWRDQLDVP